MNINEYIGAFKVAGLQMHEYEMKYVQRKNEAFKKDFIKVTQEEVVRKITKDEKTRIIAKYDNYYHKVRMEWFYNNNTNDFPSCYFLRVVFKPPFFSRVKWKVNMVSLIDLKAIIPYDTLQRIEEIKKLNLFNCFYAFIPSVEQEEKSYLKISSNVIIVAAILHGYVNGGLINIDGSSWGLQSSLYLV